MFTETPINMKTMGTWTSLKDLVSTLMGHPAVAKFRCMLLQDCESHQWCLLSGVKAKRVDLNLPKGVLFLFLSFSTQFLCATINKDL